MEILTLENINALTIYKVFEDAFTGYFVEFDRNPKTHLERWMSAGVDFSLSYGVKVDGVLAAFLLHAARGNMVMNLATGVKREFWGQGFTGMMYERIQKDLAGRTGRLEVITENAKAIRAYEKAGFNIRRKLLSYKGEFGELRYAGGDFEIKPVILTDEHEKLSPFESAFEQSAPVIARRISMLELHELRENGKLVAYAVWNPWKMNLVQLTATDKTTLESLLAKMNLSGKHAGMINVDENDEIVNGVLAGKGLVNFLSQYEMETTFR